VGYRPHPARAAIRHGQKQGNAMRKLLATALFAIPLVAALSAPASAQTPVKIMTDC
jgi:hypothetical protein